MGKFQGSIKKEVEFPGVFKKNSCRISVGLGFSFGLIPEKLQTGGWGYHGISRGRVIEERVCGNSRQLGKLLKRMYQSGFQWAPSKNMPIRPSLYQRKHDGVLFLKKINYVVF